MAALELGRHQIRVNAVCPGKIHTNIEESTTKRHTEKIGIKVELPQGNPAIDGGQGDPEEVAGTCLFLASDLSRHVSGVEIFVGGGRRCSGKGCSARAARNSAKPRCASGRAGAAAAGPGRFR